MNAGLNETAVTTPRGFSVVSVSPTVPAYPLSGPTGGNAGDRIQRIIYTVINPTMASIVLFDGGEEFDLMLPNTNTPYGPGQIELGIYSNIGAWAINAGAGLVNCQVVGSFS
jgi:hypothetical protein